MTDLEFATCDLERYSQVYNNHNRKKFSELTFGDPIYCVQVEIIPAIGMVKPIMILQKAKLQFRKLELEKPNNPKSRKARIYVTDTHGIIADKNVSAFVRNKYIYKKETFIQIYGTSLEECIYKAEKMTNIKNLDEKLIWTKPNI